MHPILESIGNTPLATLDDIHVKLEYLNPSGSIKDRIAKYIIEKAEKTGKLKKGYSVIEATSGNTGIAFSLVCALKGYPMTVVMPEGMSQERTAMIRSYGSKIVSVKGECFSCAIEKAEKLGKKSKTYLPRQFSNPWNSEEHEKFLGQEILKGVKKVDAFVAGVGTGGTVIGVGKALKKKFPRVKIFALEPDECSLLAEAHIGKVYGPMSSGKLCKHHDIQGIGDGIIPDIVTRNSDVIDHIIEIKSKDALTMMKTLCTKGYFLGPSSGANYLAAQMLKKNTTTS